MIVKVVEQYVKKGSSVYIEGALQTRKWTDKDGQERYSTEIVIQRFNGQLTMLGGRGSDADEGAGGGGGYARSGGGGARRGRPSRGRLRLGRRRRGTGRLRRRPLGRRVRPQGELPRRPRRRNPVLAPGASRAT